MAQPVEVPRWSDDDPGTTTTEPNEPTKDTGFVVAEKPPAQTLNWLHYWTYQWLVYLQNLAGEAFTWTAAHVFSLLATFSQGLTATTGNITATAGNIVATLGNVVATTGTVQGASVTTDQTTIRHAVGTLVIPMCAGIPYGYFGNLAGGVSFFEDGVTLDTTNGSWYLPVMLPVGERIRTLGLTGYTDNASNAIEARLHREELTTGTVELLQTNAIANTSRVASVASGSLGAGHVIVTGWKYFILVEMATLGADTGHAYAVTVQYDRVA